MKKTKISRYVFGLFFLFIPLILLPLPLYSEIELKVAVERKSIRVASSKSQAQELNWESISPYETRITVSGKTDYPPGTWIILTLLFNGERLPKTAVLAEVDKGGVIQKEFAIFKGSTKMLASQYQLEAIFLPFRQPYFLKQVLSQRKEEIKIINFDVGSIDEQDKENNEYMLFMQNLVNSIKGIHDDILRESKKYYPKNLPERIKELAKKERTCYSGLCFEPQENREDFKQEAWTLFSKQIISRIVQIANICAKVETDVLVHLHHRLVWKIKELGQMLMPILNMTTDKLSGISEIEQGEKTSEVTTNKQIEEDIGTISGSFLSLYKSIVTEIESKKNLTDYRNLQTTIYGMQALYDEISNRFNFKNKEEVAELVGKLAKQNTESRKVIEEYIGSLTNQLTELKNNLEKQKNSSFFVKNTSAFNIVRESMKELKNMIAFLSDLTQIKQPQLINKFEKLKKQFIELKLNYLYSMGKLLHTLMLEDVYIALQIEYRIRDLESEKEGIKNEIEVLFEILSNKDIQAAEISNAFNRLVEMGEETIDYIVDNKMLQHKNSEVRVYSLNLISVIGQKKDQRLIGYLRNYYNALEKESDREIEKMYLVETLGRVGDETVLDILHKAAYDKSERIRGFAIYSIGNIGSLDSVDVVIDLLADPVSIIREKAKSILESLTKTSLDVDLKSMTREELKKLVKEKKNWWKKYKEELLKGKK